MPRRRKRSSASGRRSRRSRGEGRGQGSTWTLGRAGRSSLSPSFDGARQSAPFHTFCITSEVGLIPSGPARKLAVQKQTTSLSVRVGHALPALSCPRTAASSTAAARPRSTRQTVRARARTRTSCSLSCKTCSGRTRSWRCACAGLMPSGALGSASLLTWGLWAWAAVSPSGRGSDTTESHPGPPTRDCWPQSHLGGPGDRPGAAARSAPQLTDRVSAEQENTPGKEGALQVHRGVGALPRGRQAC